MPRRMWRITPAARGPADLMGSELQPDFLAPYTKWEMEQACEFLVRMGAIEPRHSTNR